MDYRKTAQEIYDHVGKKENIISAAHCATRLRLVIADNDKADKEYVENIDGVKGVFFAQGQMQIILGTGVVNKVYDEFIQIAGISESSKDELKKVAASKANPVQRLIKTLGDIFVPIIPAIVASGFLMGIMEALNFMVNNGFLNINTNGSIYVFAQLFSNISADPYRLQWCEGIRCQPLSGCGYRYDHDSSKSAECLDCCNRGCAGNAEGMVWTLLH